MRTALNRPRFRLAGLFVALLVLAGGVAALASGAPTAHQTRAALALTRRNPATVRGTGFKPHTHVRVVLRTSQTVVHRPFTNAQGHVHDDVLHGDRPVQLVVDQRHAAGSVTDGPAWRQAPVPAGIGVVEPGPAALTRGR